MDADNADAFKMPVIACSYIFTETDTFKYRYERNRMLGYMAHKSDNRTSMKISENRAVSCLAISLIIHYRRPAQKTNVSTFSRVVFSVSFLFNLCMYEFASLW